MNHFVKSSLAATVSISMLANQVFAYLPPDFLSNSDALPVSMLGEPLWWTSDVYNVVRPNVVANNAGPANIGQAKHMVSQALAALDPIAPAMVTQIRADLSSILDLSAPNPKTPEWLEKQRALLLLGQLKSLADPFYRRLHALAPAWLEAERIANGTNSPNSIFPWTSATSDDANKSLANIGQLKSVFSLRYDNLAAHIISLPLDTDGDGIPDMFELANGSDPNVDDRDEIKPGTDLTFAEHYTAAILPSVDNANPPQETIPELTILGSHQPVSALKGSFSVGGDGSSTYSLPIDIPKGTAGMEPNISLNYSSSGGNSVAGLGWSIGGLQSITRGVASIAKDGYAGTMNFDANDRFFFNGERLICVSGTYGAENSEYRTEIDSFARITLRGGNQNSANAWWQVQTKAGLNIELGRTTDSKVNAPDSKGTLTWDVSKVADTLENYYSVTWADTRTPDGLNLNDRRLDRVSYTGTKSFAPYCHIIFGYQDRPDKSFAYHQTGLRMESNFRLRSVTVKTEATDNHTYLIDYQSSIQTNRSLISSIYKQQPDGSKVAATRFSWSGLKAGEAKWARASNNTLPNFKKGVQFLDLNSDGLVDIIDQGVTNWQWTGIELVPIPANVSGSAYRNTGTGFVQDTSLLPSPRYSLLNTGEGEDWSTRFDLPSRPCDINGDGQLDLFVTELRTGGSISGATSSQRYKFLTRANGAWVEMTNYQPNFESSSFGAWNNTWYPGHKHLTAKELQDMNRDGYPDLLIETHSNGRLVTTTSPASVILPSSTRTVFLNLVHKGQGWVRADNYAPPMQIGKSNDGVNRVDTGNRLLDYTGDGFLDMVSATYVPPRDRDNRGYDQRAARKFYSSGSNNTSWNNQDFSSAWIPTAPYPSTHTDSGTLVYRVDRDKTTPLIYTAGMVTDSAPFGDLDGTFDAGTTLIDLNGDGLSDITRSMTRFFNYRLKRNSGGPFGGSNHDYYKLMETSRQSWFNSGRETSTACSRWSKDRSASGNGYTLPLSLRVHDWPALATNVVQSAYSFIDLNGDGLVDISYAAEGNWICDQDGNQRGSRTTRTSDPFGGTNNGGFINTGRAGHRTSHGLFPMAFASVSSALRSKSPALLTSMATASQICLGNSHQVRSPSSGSTSANKKSSPRSLMDLVRKFRSNTSVPTIPLLP